MRAPLLILSWIVAAAFFAGLIALTVYAGRLIVHEGGWESLWTAAGAGGALILVGIAAAIVGDSLDA